MGRATEELQNIQKWVLIFVTVILMSIQDNECILELE